MPYGPPSGNTVSYYFFVTGYSPPAGNGAAIVFGGSYPPPFGGGVNFIFTNPTYSPPGGNAVAFVFGSGSSTGSAALPFRPFVQLFYRQRFTKKWHKGWRARHNKVKLSIAPPTPVLTPTAPPKNLMLYRQRFTKKWHKGWRPRPHTKRFLWLPNASPARVTWIGQEVSNTGAATQNVRVTWIALEVANQGDQVQRVRVTWMGLEVVCSLQGLDDGIMSLIL